MLQCMLCSEIQFSCNLKKEEEKKVNRRQAKQTTTIKQIKTKKNIIPPSQLFSFVDKISISVSTATISSYDLRQDGKDNIYIFFQWLVIGLMLGKIMVPHYRKMYWFAAALFCERLKV